MPSLRDERQRLSKLPMLQGDAFCASYAAAADLWLTGLLVAAAGSDVTGLALVAVGGYGRGELCPFSDLDLVLIHSGRRDIKAVADAIWYPVWDEGVRLDHSVRKPSEVLATAKQDLRVQLGLLDGRCVAGDTSISDPLLSDAAELWRRQAPKWMPLL